ncbi:hypothetical protein DPMN_075904 [Dreissena polymorpha]|uniref:Uncharacterized protein n=1 Tax=Dreissena polymorpha TaxID=45954 RepID=A0A9D4BMY2_DREPO|nr:hypothetical protein DPMN_075904 [Dreissena polymorpha]
MKGLTAYPQKRSMLTSRPVLSYYTRSSARHEKKKKFHQSEKERRLAVSFMAAHGRLRSENQSDARPLTLTFPVPAGYRLGNKDIDG